MKTFLRITIQFLVIFRTMEQDAYLYPYDEDMIRTVPARGLYHSSVQDPALKLIGLVNNCTCRENPNTHIICFGVNCTSFPSSLNITAPLFTIKLTSLKIIKQNDLNTFGKIETLEIESNENLAEIEPKSFRFLSELKTLTISANPMLVRFNSEVFYGLVNLKTLCVRGNGFRHVLDISEGLSQRSLPRVEIVDISEHNFVRIAADEFAPMRGSSLQELRMVLCRLEDIHSDSLAPLHHLNILKIGENLFNTTVLMNLIRGSMRNGISLEDVNLYSMGVSRVVPYDLMKAFGASTVTFVHLTKNHYEHIGDYSFPEMPKLKELSLRYNLITDIGPNALVNLKNLQGLYLGQNHLSGVPLGVLLPTLTCLDLAGNIYEENGERAAFFSVDDGIFQNMSNLLNLQLAYNNIAYLTKISFVGLKKLEILNLKNTSLYYIEIGTFEPLHKLKHLNLINNFLLGTTLTPELFKGMNSLIILLLGGCGLTNITSTPSLFAFTPKLIHLGLEQNKLYSIAPHQLLHLNRLESVNVAENRLTAYNESILPENVKLLDASKNKFTHVTVAMLKEIEHLVTLYLDGNPFSCDCSFYSMAIFFKTNPLPELTQSDGDNFVATCISPEKWRGKSIVKYLATLYYDEYNECNSNRSGFILVATIIPIFLFITGAFCYIHRLHIQHYFLIWRFALRKQKFKLYKKNTNLKYDAFISYAKQDHDFVMRLVEQLENHQPYLRLCIFERDFPVGAMISDAIIQGLVASRRTILIVSDAYIRSEWCNWETQIAEYYHMYFQSDHSLNVNDDTMLIIRLGDVQKENMTLILKYLMKTRIYLQYDSDKLKQKIFWEKLRAFLTSSTNRLTINHCNNSKK